ncbi:MAG: nucleotidyl transferase AbiEii/AbiGii toxin family protein [Lachnospiraceae bacterium]|nr:nucleotidyl transferase AbiEii/AbiGii toxin family protein [Lachnospiraceae bacterium]
MTKLEWCRAHAPDAIRNLPDDELLTLMESAYNSEYIDKNISLHDMESVEYNPINDMMDYMVLTLVREFGDKLAFKGGYMLTKLIPESARQTTDIDFSIQTSALYQQLIQTMRAIGDHFIFESLISHYNIKEEIRGFMSGGMDMYDDSGAKVLGIDVGWHDISFGTQLTSISVGTVRAFSVERMLSDKITAILSRKKFRRPKDIYDLYCITNSMSFNAILVNEYIVKRTNGAGADWKNYPFSDDVLREYGKAYNSLKVHSIFKDRSVRKPDFDAVMCRFDTVCDKLLHPSFEFIWDPKAGVFINEHIT